MENRSKLSLRKNVASVAGMSQLLKSSEMPMAQGIQAKCRRCRECRKGYRFKKSNGMDIFERLTNPNYKPKPKPKAEVIELSDFKQPIDRWDNRITCSRCSYLATNGQCLNAKAAGAPGKYHPKPDIPRRCQGFKAGGI